MGGLADVLSFEGFNLKEIGRKIKKDPERLLIGAVDPASTKVWNKALGKDYEPMVDQFGGASSDTYGKAEAAGINTGPGKAMHGAARAVAAFYAGGYGADKLGLGAAASPGGSSAAGPGLSVSPGQGLNLASSGSSVGEGLGTAGGSGLSLGGSGGMTVGETMGASGGSGLTGSIGDGIGSSIPEGSAIAGDFGTGSGGKSWMDMLRRQGSFPGQMQQQQQRPLDQDEVRFDAEGRPYIQSSRKLKTGGRGLSDALVARGASGTDPISQNGVQIAAIQALTKQVVAMERRIKDIKKKRGVK